MGKSLDLYEALNEEKNVYVLRMLNVNSEMGNDLVFGVYLTHEEARHNGLTLRRLDGKTWPDFEVKRESGSISDPRFLRHFIEALVWKMSNAASYKEQIHATMFESPEDEEYFRERADVAGTRIEDIRRLLSEISAACHVDIEFPPVEEIVIFNSIRDNLNITCNHAE